MTSPRQLHLGAFMRPASIHTGAWRYPDAWPDMNFNFAHLKYCIQVLERAKFDAFFMADHMAVLNMPLDALKRSHTVTSFEPFTLLSALSQVTARIGLVATGSTTFDAPYHIARRFASLDHISGGRAGWNIVTTSNPDAALNFGLEGHVEHGVRYRRAREFYDMVTGLWTAGPMTPSSAMSSMAFSSTQRKCMCSITSANIFPCADRSISPGRSRAGR
jgi:alkanesulfonate monooxygenase